MSDMRDAEQIPDVEDEGDLSDSGGRFDAELHEAEAEADDELGR